MHVCMYAYVALLHVPRPLLLTAICKLFEVLASSNFPHFCSWVPWAVTIIQVLATFCV
jgi:hypothetical protein